MSGYPVLRVKEENMLKIENIAKSYGSKKVLQ